MGGDLGLGLGFRGEEGAADVIQAGVCLLYTSDAADERVRV